MLLIQPTVSRRAEYAALAAREGLRYELLEPFLPPYLDDPEAQGVCASRLTAGGLAYALHGAFIDVNPASGDAALRALSRQRTAESCEAAEALGLRFVILHGSCFPFLRGAFLDAWADSCAAFYAELAARYPSLTLCLENSFDLDPGPIRAVLDRCAAPQLGVCLDLGHVHYSRAPLSAWLDALGDRTVFLHLSDNGGLFDDHLPIGSGTVDWADASRRTRFLGDVPMTLEVGGPEGIETSLRFLREHALFGA